MLLAVILALSVSVVLYLGIGIWYGSSIRGLGDHLPVLRGGQARVVNHREFAASTVAATISLATVVVAFFELAAQRPVLLTGVAGVFDKRSVGDHLIEIVCGEKVVVNSVSLARPRCPCRRRNTEANTRHTLPKKANDRAFADA